MWYVVYLDARRVYNRKIAVTANLDIAKYLLESPFKGLNIENIPDRIIETFTEAEIIRCSTIFLPKKFHLAFKGGPSVIIAVGHPVS